MQTINRTIPKHTSLTNLTKLLTILALVALTNAFPFEDVSLAAGMQRPYGPRIKFGGAAVADVNADGYPDLLFAHHDDRFADLYINNQDGTFKRNTWGAWRDTHAFNPVRLSPYVRRMHFSLSQGGSNGAFLKSPEMYAVLRNDRIKEVTVETGISTAMIRGRSAIFMQLNQKASKYPDVIYTSAPVRNAETGLKGSLQYAFEGMRRKRFAHRNLTGFDNVRNTYGTVTDVDGDGKVELVTFQELRMHRVVGPFEFEEITSIVLPGGESIERVVGVAELDFDNDGLWDLYIARTTTENLRWQGRKPHDDILLRNIGGRYVDVSASAGVPTGTQTRGVTVGDFNNDGYVDIVLPQYEEDDIILFNNGNGTFNTVSAGFERNASVHGDMATAVDFDRDGRLDIILSEGDWGDKDFAGFFRIMKNIGETDRGNSLLVRVRNSPKRRSTSLHAVVIVTAPGLYMMRRVGSPGTVTGNSYIELMHFGIGNLEEVNDITVRWPNGEWEMSYNDTANGEVLNFGRA